MFKKAHLLFKNNLKILKIKIISMSFRDEFN